VVKVTNDVRQYLKGDNSDSSETESSSESEEDSSYSAEEVKAV